MRKRFTITVLTALMFALVCTLWTGQLGAQAPGGQGRAPGAEGRAPGRGAGPGMSFGDPAMPKKHVLVLAFTEGFHHESTSDGAATIWELGEESGLFDVEIRTDTKWLVKGSPTQARTLSWFDAIVAVNTTGVWQMTDEQKKDFIAAIHDDGKGFVAVHAALDSHRNGVWPEYTEMLGGEFVAHPWFTFAAPLIIEDQSFPAMRHFASKNMVMYDEWYVASEDTWSRGDVNVLMRLDESKLPPPGIQEPYATRSGLGAMMRGANNPMAAASQRGIREDQDYAVAWSKTYGKGRVFYSSIGHVRELFRDPDVRKMYLEGIKWVLGFSEGSTATHPKVN